MIVSLIGPPSSVVHKVNVTPGSSFKQTMIVSKLFVNGLMKQTHKLKIGGLVGQTHMLKIGGLLPESGTF